MSQYTKIKEKIAELEKEAEAARKAEIQGAIKQIQDIMAQFDLDVEDLKGAKKRSTVAAKYRDPATGSTWTGRGKMPNWLKAHEEEGRKREDFLIV